MIIQDTTLIKIFKDKIEEANKVVIIPHNNPDGDALGSALGLYNLLVNMGKQANVIVPNEFPGYLSWMPGISDLSIYDKTIEQSQGLMNEADLIVMVDFNALSRVEFMEPFLKEHAVPRIMIDHHPYPQANTAQWQISVPEASSTCELLYQVIIEADFVKHMTKEAGECIYSGIMTDTGSLNYNSNRPETYYIVAELLKLGIDKEHIHHRLFHSNSFDKMRLFGHALGAKMERLPEQKGCFIALSQKELLQYNYQPGDTEGLVNQALWIEGVDVSALIVEKDNVVKFSFRSRGEFPVNKFSEKYFSGGGHHNAAGGITKLKYPEAIAKFKEALAEFRAEWESNK
jgi:phosphoesterase RecJ-like protein